MQQTSPQGHKKRKETRRRRRSFRRSVINASLNRRENQSTERISVINVSQVQQSDEVAILRCQMEELTAQNRKLERERNERRAPLQIPIQYQQQQPPAYQYNWPQHMGNYSYCSHERTPPVTPPIDTQAQAQQTCPKMIQPAPARVIPTTPPRS